MDHNARAMVAVRSPPLTFLFPSALIVPPPSRSSLPFLYVFHAREALLIKTDYTVMIGRKQQASCAVAGTGVLEDEQDLREWLVIDIGMSDDKAETILSSPDIGTSRDLYYFFFFSLTPAVGYRA